MYFRAALNRNLHHLRAESEADGTPIHFSWISMNWLQLQFKAYLDLPSLKYENVFIFQLKCVSMLSSWDRNSEGSKDSSKYSKYRISRKSVYPERCYWKRRELWPHRNMKTVTRNINIVVTCAVLDFRITTRSIPLSSWKHVYRNKPINRNQWPESKLTTQKALGC